MIKWHNIFACNVSGLAKSFKNKKINVFRGLEMAINPSELLWSVWYMHLGISLNDDT